MTKHLTETPWELCRAPPNDLWYAGRTIGLAIPGGQRICDLPVHMPESEREAVAELICSAQAMRKKLSNLTWQPIESAPFYESLFVYCRIYGRFIAYKERIAGTDCGQWCNWNGEKGILPPVAWMPLPEPPNAEGQVSSASVASGTSPGAPCWQATDGD